MSTFYLIRHGEKDAPDTVLSGRGGTIHLSDRGHRQAEMIAARFSYYPVEQIFSSPLARARETAEPLATEKKLTMQISAAFNEVDFGVWTNQPIEKLESDPRWRAYNSYRGIAEIPGGETIPAVQRRFVEGMLHLAHQFPRDHIAIFSHREPILAAVLRFIGLTLDAWARFELGVASVTTLTLEGESAKLISLNDTFATQANGLRETEPPQRAEAVRSLRKPPSLPTRTRRV